MRALRARVRRTLLTVVSALGLTLVPSAGWAEAPVDAKAPEAEARKITFSRLIVRPKDQGRISATNEVLRVLVVEYLRKNGIAALGAESLVFDRDESSDADLVLGGTVFHLECAREEVTHCVVGIDWEILDVMTESVVYQFRGWGEMHQYVADGDDIAQVLIESALKSLISKPPMRALLAPVKAAESTANYPKAELGRCSQKSPPVAENGEHSLNAVAIVQEAKSFGSGFMISDGPFLMTAAHVVRTSRPKVTFRSGHVTRASVIRIDETADVALLRVDEPPPDQQCLQVLADPDTKVGKGVFALGSPASQDFSFSMSRGILSGVRLINGIRQLQTDASINPGNSGGPLIDENGIAIGVTSWKIKGGAIEGLGFAVSLSDALAHLQLSLSDRSDPALLTDPAVGLEPAPSKAFVEQPDRQPVLNPRAAERKRKNDEVARVQKLERDRRDKLRAMTPIYIPVMRWGGLILTAGGAATAIGSALKYDRDGMSEDQFRSTRTVNDVGWVVGIVGASAALLSFPLAPSLKDVDRAGASAEVGLTPDGRLQLSGSF